MALPDAEPKAGAPRVLLVDDDEGFVETFGALLARAGYAVTTKTTYGAARQHLGSNQADVLITDIRLDSEVNGWQLAKYATQQQPSVPVIVITGWSDAREAEIEYFRVPVFLKPFDPEEVLAYLQAAMPAA
jgi:DNA-binding NtrC family response regulator